MRQEDIGQDGDQRLLAGLTGKIQTVTGLIDPEKGGKITKDEAIYLLHNDIDECSASLDNSLSWWRSKPAKIQMALMHMRFQLGMTGVLKFKKTLVLIQADRFKEAAIEARDSRWAKQTTRRAKYVTGLIEDA